MNVANTSNASNLGADDQALIELSGEAATTHIKNGDITAERYAQALLRQHERTAAWHAVTWIAPDQVLEDARAVDQRRKDGKPLGPLAGIPLLVKDNIDTKGFATSAGTAGLKKHMAKKNAPVIKKLWSKGAILLAKGNMHELAAGVTSSNAAFGFAANPYNPKRVPGGSSGGVGTGLAARIAPMGLGSDTGGSVRIPASYCGLTGLRPSAFRAIKRWPDAGVVPLILDLDTVGPMARTMGDIALLDAAIAGGRRASALKLKGVRLGIPRSTHWHNLDPQIERISQEALRRLKDAGAVLVEIDIQELTEQVLAALNAMTGLIVPDLAAFLKLRQSRITVADVAAAVGGADVRAMMEHAMKAPPDPAILAVIREKTQPELTARYVDIFAQHGLTAIVFPTTPTPPPLIETGGDGPKDTITINGVESHKGMTIAGLTRLTCFYGAPGLSLPAGQDVDGIPAGLEFDGLPGQDRALIGLGLAAEKVLPHVPPPQYP